MIEGTCMPTILRVGRFRFFFYSNENNKPPHVPVRADSDEAKFWLQPVQLATNYGFNSSELNDIEDLVNDHALEFVEA